MTTPDPDAPWYDGDAGPLVRPFAVTGGRTHPTQFLEMVTLVVTVSARDAPSPEHREILHRCRQPLSVAEVAAAVDLPIGAAKVLISDLIEQGALIARSPDRESLSLDRQLIRTVIDGIRRL
jgi:Protein of unknown function (DUF742)